jgi:hypothetical protein
VVWSGDRALKGAANRRVSRCDTGRRRHGEAATRRQETRRQETRRQETRRQAARGVTEVDLGAPGFCRRAASVY